MIFEYDQQPVFMQNIDIMDIGNVALRCSNIKLRDYYIVVKTYLGKTALISYGPVVSDVNALVDNMSLTFKKFDYKELTIEREIEKIINDGRSAINNVEIISEAEALAHLPSAQSFINSL
jgi:hypothetical protein